MKRKVFIIFGAVLVIFGLGSCLSNKVVDKDHNARNSLDWEGVYTGTIPWASERINVRLRLYMDQRFELEYEYLDRTVEPINYFPGSFQWDDTGNIIIIEIIDTITRYKVAENKLIELDLNEKQILGKPAGDHVLKKEL
jgi:uncharacterized lipoprotein NlpE involved in copper resistance